MPEISRPVVTLRARYVFPVAGDPIPGGVLSIAEGRIVSVGRTADGPVTDLGDVALLPGLINAHVHLEFSGLQAPLGACGMPFADWIRLVVAYRRGRTDPVDDAVARGLAESLRHGVTGIGDIATLGWSAAALTGFRGGLCAFWELIGLSRQRAAQSLTAAQSHLLAAQNRPWRAGLSPHAPYTARPDLYVDAVGLCAAVGAPLATHLAESEEELELLDSGRGPLAKLLVELGAWEAGAIPTGARPLDYLQILAGAPRSLIVHGNYLDEEEISFVARHSATMAVVYCPRTQAWFGHDEHPLSRMLAAGCSVALGTDGRTSSPDLNLLAEARHAAGRHAFLSPRTAVELATLRGARALGWQQHCGSLSAGKQADVAIVQLAGPLPTDPHEALLGADLPVLATICRGKLAYAAEDLRPLLVDLI